MQVRRDIYVEGSKLYGGAVRIEAHGLTFLQRLYAVIRMTWQPIRYLFTGKADIY